MMYGYDSIMTGFGFLGVLLWTVMFIDLVLVGILLWKKISEK